MTKAQQAENHTAGGYGNEHPVKIGRGILGMHHEITGVPRRGEQHANRQHRNRNFPPGGAIVDFQHPVHHQKIDGNKEGQQHQRDGETCDAEQVRMLLQQSRQVIIGVGQYGRNFNRRDGGVREKENPAPHMANDRAVAHVGQMNHCSSPGNQRTKFRKNQCQQKNGEGADHP